MRQASTRLLVVLLGTVAGGACATAAGVTRPQPFPVAPSPSSHSATPPPVPTPFPIPASALASSVTSTSESMPPLPETTPLVAVSTSNAELIAIPVASVDPDGVEPPGAPVTARRVDAMLKTALSLQGTRYRLGGEVPASGFDCSGFVHYVFEQQQIDVPRTVAEQFSTGQKVPYDQIQRGDLLFFTTTAKGPTHVGISLGPSSLGQFVHAPGSGGVVRIEHFDTSYWRTRLLGVRRVVKK